MIYYRRTVWLIATFLVLVFIGIVLGFAMVLFQGRRAPGPGITHFRVDCPTACAAPRKGRRARRAA